MYISANFSQLLTILLKTLSEFEHEALARALDDILSRTNWAWQNAKNIVADK